ncbi:MAG: hypothetical protein ABEJ06_05780 [Haloarculaceae archaeon]
MLPLDAVTALPSAGGGFSGFTVGAAVVAVLAGGAYELARRGRLFCSR